MTMVTSKPVVRAYEPGSRHMVGDGFDVRNLFPSNNLGQQISPFLLLDYAGPTYYPPTNQPRGVGEHPHRASCAGGRYGPSDCWRVPSSQGTGYDGYPDAPV